MGERTNGPFGRSSKLDRILGIDAVGTASPLAPGQQNQGRWQAQRGDQGRSQGQDTIPYPPSAHTRDGSSDIEQGLKLNKSTTPYSRAQLPAGTRSQSSLPTQQFPTSSQPGLDDTNANNINPNANEDSTWGPSHPCYPHLNPHVPLSSPLYSSTRIIRIKRDWMLEGDLAPTFSNLYPEILDPILTEDQFRTIIGRLNDQLTAIFDPLGWRNWLDLILGVITLWAWDDAGMTAAKKGLQAVEQTLEDWNRDFGALEGVTIIPLRRTAYMTLDIQIPDPQIGNAESTLAPSRPTTEPQTQQQHQQQQQQQRPPSRSSQQLPITGPRQPLTMDNVKSLHP
ncbi:MAG: hypothetical protein M1825_000984 [Sarcosagium campestre]|nr:MAG: hypothetical protein M1825_000984 [Sarcosagium campestre]